MSSAGTEGLSAMTPMMRQYYELKARCPDGILFFRMGDFYEVFGKEAEEIAPKLEIALTSRERGDQQRIPFCGVPHHSAQGYWLRLLKSGYKVVVADQVEEAAQAKGLVQRDIVRVMSPGCIDELEGLEQESPNYIMTAYEDPGTRIWAFCFADISTGELRLGSCQSPEQLKDWLENFRPRELVCRSFCRSQLEQISGAYRNHHSLLFSTLPEGVLRDERERQTLLTEVLGSASLESQLCGDVPGGESVLAGMFRYLKDHKIGTDQFLKVLPLQDSDTFVLAETAVRDLEIFETSRSRSRRGSLFQNINQCMSPMGARLLRKSLAHPFRSEQAIHLRHAAIQELCRAGSEFVGELRAGLQGMGDIERLTTRLVSGSIRPQELARLRDSLRRAEKLADILEQSAHSQVPLLGKQLKNLRSAAGVCQLLMEALLEQPLAIPSEGDGVFRSGFDGELDRYNEFARHGEEKAAQYLEVLKTETGISSLKIKRHKTFGMILEVTKSNLAKVPDCFIRRQTMVNCERFVTDELSELDESLISSQDRAIEREKTLYDGLLRRLLSGAESLRQVAAAVAYADMLQSFSWLSLNKDYCLSQLVTHKEQLCLQSVRHPVVEDMVGRHQFVANDISMGPDQKQLLITGPNMAGKSTVMRQVALCAILNQAGGVVPASHASLPVFDGIFTRVGASDDLSRGLSTFMVEMSETAFILRNATAQSLVILDEVGRGTSTEDGLAIASAILEYISRKSRCWTLFATHYHELAEYSSELKSVRTVQTEVAEKDGKIRFTHRLVEGASGSSYGLEVAQIAGVPDDVMLLANKHLKHHKSVCAADRSIRESGKSRNYVARELFSPDNFMPDASGLSAELTKLKEKLESVKLDSVTPLQALNILSRLKSGLEKQRPVV